MNEIKVKNLLKTPYLATRDMALKLERYYQPESTFDFCDVDFISAAFADEFKRKFFKSRIINTKENVREMLAAVSHREKSD